MAATGSNHVKGGHCQNVNPHERQRMNQIIYIVGLIVIVLFILGYFGLR